MINRLAFTISTPSPDAIGVQMFSVGGGTPGSVAWPAANDAILIPISIRFPCIVHRMYAINGVTVSGNIDVGIYAEDGTLIVSSGSTAQAGTTAPQYFNITDTFLGPGNYYMGIAKDDTTGTLRRYSLVLEKLILCGVIKGTSSFPLPATFSFVTATATYVPHVGIDLVGTLT